MISEIWLEIMSLVAEVPCFLPEMLVTAVGGFASHA